MAGWPLNTGWLLHTGSQNRGVNKKKNNNNNNNTIKTTILTFEWRKHPKLTLISGDITRNIISSFIEWFYLSDRSLQVEDNRDRPSGTKWRVATTAE